MKVVYNVSEEEAQEIKKKIKENGGHCLCAIKKTMDTKCMCKEFRDKMAEGYFGECACGLYKSIPTIVYIYGDICYVEDFLRWNQYFSHQGMLVLLPGRLGGAQTVTLEESNNLININTQKIQFSDIVFIIDKYGRIDEITDKVIKEAKKSGKKIVFASEIDD